MALGNPASACIRDHRARLAEDRLQTNLPVYLIGVRVGLPDPPAFKKFMRRNRGLIPLAIRKARA